MTFDELTKINYLFDSHAHINDCSFDDDREEIIQKAFSKNVRYIFDVGIDLKSSQKAIEISKKFYPNVLAFVGIDPEVFIPGSSLFSKSYDEKFIDKEILKLYTLFKENKNYIVGIGETGLDFYWLNKKMREKEITQNEIEISIKLQKRLFQKNIDLAKEFNLVLTVHSREAEKETFETIKNSKASAIFHSYTGDYNIAKKILDIGCGLGVNGIITFKNATKLREVYKKILGKVTYDWGYCDFYKKGVFFETDCPFLSPSPNRGSKNSPENISSIYEYFINFLSE
ncbi:MAG: deoxyribonuclease [Candidatus Dojkabacteria bacterium]|nr:MAG: deoxyribonuclease [Candidatus Dojkabacteria bacterium]